jgi:hypothetical protein
MKTIKLLHFGIFACVSLWLLGCAGPLKEDPMVGEGQKVSVEFTLKLDDGTIVDSNVGKDPLVFQSGQKEIMPALEQGLMGMKVNDTKKLRLTPEQGFGLVDPRGIQTVKPDQIPADSRKVGAVIVATDSEGRQQPVRVLEVQKDKIIVDLTPSSRTESQLRCAYLGDRTDYANQLIIRRRNS